MTAAVFPGQGSQKTGMGQELFLAHAEAHDVFDEVSGATGIDVTGLCFGADEETLRRTENTQIALFTCSVASFRCIPSSFRARFSGVAGHSVGEYAALAAAEIITASDGARLVRRRGQLMAAAPPGAMSAVIGLERDLLEEACKEANGMVVVANDNSPGQLVISGESVAVARAGELASRAGAKRVLPLKVGGAFHSPLMESAADEFAQDLRQVQFSPGNGLAVYSNVTAQPVTQPSEWPHLLARQLKSPVRWTETVQNMASNGTARFVECGVGEVLSGLIRRISKDVATLRVNDDETLSATLAALNQQS